MMLGMQVLASQLAHLGQALVALGSAAAVHRLTMLLEDRKQQDRLSRILQQTAGQRSDIASGPGRRSKSAAAARCCTCL